MQRWRIDIEGIVQGVGFRPFVYQVALRCGLSGWVRNDSRGVTVEAQGEEQQLQQLLHALQHEAPPLAMISTCHQRTCAPLPNETGFVIHASADGSDRLALIAPDSHVCPDCLRELFDPADRRYRYPFINCTNCGPRYTIITRVPYDRPATTMADFPMCPACLAEYRDPTSRRFHAQPNACPSCGPRLTLRDSAGTELPGDPLAAAIDLLREGRIVAVKGLGGYHFAVDASSEAAVAELRRRKARDEKPFAVMVRDLTQVRSLVELEPLEEQLLAGPERPIVLLRKRSGVPLAAGIAPGNRYLGVMLPYTPLHYLLLQADFPALVMTSGNLSDEPIAFTDHDASLRLAAIADAFLVHDRRIHMRTDDSIARVMTGRPLLLRRSRGYVPRSLLLPAVQEPVLAVGAELKSTLCLTRGDRAFLSQHIGDLKNEEVYASLEQTAEHLQGLLDIRPVIIAHDLHPDYLSTRFAEQLPGVRRVPVQHHHAHLASCLGENRWTGEAIGVIFDGLGYGSDGTVWGGEFLVGDAGHCRRAGHLLPVPLPGGDAATREPWRMALAWLAATYGEELPEIASLTAVSATDRKLVLTMCQRRLNAPLTSSCGRLFDAVSALAGLRLRVSYEGQAALELEQALDPAQAGTYPIEIAAANGLLLLDPRPLLRALVADLQEGASSGALSARFHRGLALGALELCRQLRAAGAPTVVALSGGVFQNRFLTEELAALLQADGFTVLTHSLVPPNDGGLALGQALVAAAGGSLADARKDQP